MMRVPNKHFPKATHKKNIDKVLQTSNLSLDKKGLQSSYLFIIYFYFSISFPSYSIKI